MVRSYLKKRWWWGVEIGQWLGTLDTFPGDLGWFPAPRWHLLLQMQVIEHPPLALQNTHADSADICRQNTHIHKMKISLF